jgi:hypothetical protein
MVGALVRGRAVRGVRDAFKRAAIPIQVVTNRVWRLCRMGALQCGAQRGSRSCAGAETLSPGRAFLPRVARRSTPITGALIAGGTCALRAVGRVACATRGVESFARGYAVRGVIERVDRTAGEVFRRRICSLVYLSPIVPSQRRNESSAFLPRLPCCALAQVHRSRSIHWSERYRTQLRRLPTRKCRSRW